MSHAYLNTLAFEHGVEKAAAGYTREDKSIALVRAIGGSVKDPDEKDRRFLDIAGRLLVEPRASSIVDGGEVPALLRSLELDGYELVGGTLVPKVPGPVPASEPVSWLEGQLAQRGLLTASTHFRQAVENYANGNWEACNGQVRSFLEELLLKASEARTGKTFRDPSSALQHLQQIDALDPKEAQYAKALWASLQEGGPHAGLSHHDEAVFRLHSVAALARYLITKGLLNAE